MNRAQRNKQFMLESVLEFGKNNLLLQGESNHSLFVDDGDEVTRLSDMTIKAEDEERKRAKQFAITLFFLFVLLSGLGATMLCIAYTGVLKPEDKTASMACKTIGYLFICFALMVFTVAMALAFSLGCQPRSARIASLDQETPESQGLTGLLR